jgi:hypothetical protein
MPKDIINYSNTIIYKLVCNDLDTKDCYVGHTTNFIKRKQHHKERCINPNNNKYHLKVYQIMRENGGWDNWSMIEIEKYNCNDSNEARARERYWYDILNSKMNDKIPLRTKEEFKKMKSENDKRYRLKHKEELKIYREKNKEKIIIQRKERYENNKEEILQKTKEYRDKNKVEINLKNKLVHTCVCGSICRLAEISRHYKTKKHQEFVNQNITE